MGESSCSSQMNKMNFKFLLAVFVVAVALMPTAHSLSLTTKTSPDPTEPTSTLPPSTLPPSTASPSTASTSLASPTTDCQAGWSAFNGNCYKFFSEEKTWENAKDQCVEEQANLVSLHSEEEHQFVVGLNGGFPWLGGRRDPGNGNNFVWSDGTPWDYTNWARGAPDNNKGNEDCAHMKKKVAERHKWNDRPCSHVKTFVCKKGSNWLKVFSHDTAGGLFTSNTEALSKNPDDRADHSINENIVCGGGPYNSDPNYTGHDETRSSCVTLASDGTWLETTRLLEQRYHHSSWASPSGLILLGGRGSKRTTEKIQEDGSSSYSFELKYDLDLACSINLGSTVIVTGNRDPSLP